MPNIIKIYRDIQHTNSTDRWKTIIYYPYRNKRVIEIGLWYSYSLSSKQTPYNNLTTFNNFFTNVLYNSYFDYIIRITLNIQRDHYESVSTLVDVKNNINSHGTNYENDEFCYFYSGTSYSLIINFIKHLRNSLAHGSFNTILINNKEFIILTDQYNQDITMGIKIKEENTDLLFTKIDIINDYFNNPYTSLLPLCFELSNSNIKTITTERDFNLYFIDKYDSYLIELSELKTMKSLREFLKNETEILKQLLKNNNILLFLPNANKNTFVRSQEIIDDFFDKDINRENNNEIKYVIFEQKVQAINFDYFYNN